MDRRLRADLRSMANDHASGAAELALRALIAVQGWSRRRKNPAPEELGDAAQALFAAQPSLAPVVRIANEVALAADDPVRRRCLKHTLAMFRRLIETGPAEIARRFAQARGRGRPWRVVTYSYSSTVSRALRAVPAQIKEVRCSEGRPALEGRRMASELAAAGIKVWFYTDATLLESSPGRADCLLLGADAILRGGFEAKIGSCALVESFLRARRRVWILADTSKFWPEGAIGPACLGVTWGPTQEIWAQPPRMVKVVNPYFTTVPFEKGIQLLTERGWMTDPQVRRFLNTIVLTPRVMPGGVG